MPEYHCIACHYYTNRKQNFERHLISKKHVESTKSQPRVNQKSTFSQPKVNLLSNLEMSTPFQCHYCMKHFKFKQSMYKHIKYVCKKNKDEDFKELARLMNEKDKQMKEKDFRMDKMQKQIDRLTQKLQIQNINHGTINHHNNNVLNIQLLNHNDTDYSHLTPNDYMNCINDCNKCVKTLIEKVHFNRDKPENRNIYLSNIKGKYIMIYKDNSWQIQDKKRQIDDLYDNNEVVLENWYDEYKEKYPHIIDSFKRYLINRDEDIVLNNIKEEILLMLYNKRKMVSTDIGKEVEN